MTKKLVGKMCCAGLSTMGLFGMTIALGMVLLQPNPLSARETPLARQVLAEINVARTDPRGYVAYLREFRRQFQGKRYLLPETGTFVRTREGVGAVDEAISALLRQKPLRALSWSNGLAAAAAELAEDQADSGATGHEGERAGGMQARIERHGEWMGRIGENISYGARDPRSVVLQLIVDDGVKGRGHRKNIFSEPFGRAGVACGPHARYGSMCAMDFAGGFSD